MPPAPAKASAVLPCPPVTTLTKRSDFLYAARARKQVMPGFILQARDRRTPSSGIRVGYTCSKKVGNAVARNRAKRRLREVARAILPHAGRDGWDYVLIGRQTVTASRAFDQLVRDLETALARIHRPHS
ncbi:ribonuclease P protein component [Halovulum sp. GXIMD14793]